MRTLDAAVVDRMRARRSVKHALRSALRSVLRGLWFVVIPLLGSGLSLRYLAPYTATTSGFEAGLARFARGHAVVLLFAVFATLALLIRYWRNWLPGGRYLSTLPHELVERVPRRRIAECEEACALLHSLEGSAARARLPPRRAGG